MTSARRGCRAHAALGLLSGLLLCSQGSAQPEGCPEPFGTLLREYKAFHAQMRKHPDAKYLVWRCLEGYPCQGIGNRARGIVWMLRVAMAFNRVMLIYQGQPAPMTTFLQPNEIDWTVDDFDSDYYKGNNTLQDEPYYDSIYRSNQQAQLLFNNTKVIRRNTNEHMEVHMTNIPDVGGKHPWFTHDQWQPYFYTGACLWNFLFKPSAVVEQRAVAHIQQLYGSYPVDYVAWHWRHGEADAQGTPAVRLPALDTMLQCLYDVSRTDAGVDPMQRPVMLITDFNDMRRIAMGGYFRGLTAPNITAKHVENDQDGIRGTAQQAAVDAFVDIFVDLYLLSRARCIVHGDSTFSYTAAWWGGPRLVSCRKEMSSCGNLKMTGGP